MERFLVISAVIVAGCTSERPDSAPPAEAPAKAVLDPSRPLRPKEPYNAASDGAVKEKVKELAREAIKRFLKSPTSAEFTDVAIYEPDERLWNVIGTVSAVNLFNVRLAPEAYEAVILDSGELKSLYLGDEFMDGNEEARQEFLAAKQARNEANEQRHRRSRLDDVRRSIEQKRFAFARTDLELFRMRYADSPEMAEVAELQKELEEAEAAQKKEQDEAEAARKRTKASETLERAKLRLKEGDTVTARRLLREAAFDSPEALDILNKIDAEAADIEEKRPLTETEKRFVGRWRFVDSKGRTGFYITIDDSLRAQKPDATGTYQVVGDEAHIDWSDGWRHILRLPKGKGPATNLGWGPEVDKAGKPNSILRVYKMPEEESGK